MTMCHFYPQSSITIGDKSLYVGNPESVLIKKNGSCLITPLFPPGFVFWATRRLFLIPPNKTAQFMREFLSTWDQHRVSLLTEDKPASIHYNSDTRKWTLLSKNGLSVLSVLTDYLNQDLNLLDQIQRVKCLIQSMRYQIIDNNTLAHLLSQESIDANSLGSQMSQTIALVPPNRQSHCVIL